jgi:hypothetical protein
MERDDIAIDFDADSDMTVATWSRDIETVLDQLLENTNRLQEVHRVNYLKLKSQLVYFRIPMIVLSSLNSVFSVGLSAYMQQNLVSTINCLISLVCACISSVELFLNIHKNMEITLQSYHGYKLLGIRISSTRKLDREHRDKNAIAFMNDCVSEYKKLLEQSIVTIADLDDSLLNYKAEVKNKLLTFSSPKRGLP